MLLTCNGKRVKLTSGEEFEGLLKARDPYFVSNKEWVDLH